MTERKSTRNPLPDSLFDRDYQLERQYLEKLRAQRIKTEKLFEEYTTAVRELKREKEAGSKLRQEVDELRRRLGEMEAGRDQLRTVQGECEQLKAEIKSLLADKSTLVKKFKEA
jgi:chromosome segregation ATPase